ncbi:hypothetical protein LCGC14_2698880, partial [marine sediment metagenome]
YHHALDINAYQEAWRLASQRYPVLRTAFDWDGEPLQIITAQPSLTAAHFRLEDLSQLSVTAREAAIVELQIADRAVAFDLSQPGLLRFTVIKHSDAHYTVLKTEHHSISDGWSGPLLWQTVHDYYQQLLAGQSPEVHPESTYLDAQQYLQQQQSATRSYWKSLQANLGEPNDINGLLSQPIDLSQPPVIDEPTETKLVLEEKDYQQLKAQCRAQGVTLNVAVQFAWHKLLQIYTGDEQTIVGTTVSGRDIPVAGIESSVGLYINTLPLALDWAADATIHTQLQTLQQRIAALNSHSGIALASLQRGGARLFHSLLVFENYPAPVNTGDADTLGVAFRSAVEKTDYPLSVIAYEQGDTLHIGLRHDARSLTTEKASRLVDQLQRILAAIADDPAQRHDQIPLLSRAEAQALLHSWNDTDAPYPQDKTLQQLFEAQVE